MGKLQTLYAAMLKATLAELLEPPLQHAGGSVSQHPGDLSLLMSVEQHRLLLWNPAQVSYSPDGSQASLFCTPVAGTAFCYTPLAQDLGLDQPGYGIQSPAKETIQESLSPLDDAMLVLARMYEADLPMSHPDFRQLDRDEPMRLAMEVIHKANMLPSDSGPEHVRLIRQGFKANNDAAENDRRSMPSEVPASQRIPCPRLGSNAAWRNLTGRSSPFRHGAGANPPDFRWRSI